MNLHAYAIAMYCYMASNAEDFHPSLEHMAKSIHISKPTAWKYIEVLIKHNMIQRYKIGGKGIVSEYLFTPPKEWKK